MVPWLIFGNNCLLFPTSFAIILECPPSVCRSTQHMICTSTHGFGQYSLLYVRLDVKKPYLFFPSFRWKSGVLAISARGQNDRLFLPPSLLFPRPWVGRRVCRFSPCDGGRGLTAAAAAAARRVQSELGSLFRCVPAVESPLCLFGYEWLL